MLETQIKNEYHFLLLFSIRARVIITLAHHNIMVTISAAAETECLQIYFLSLDV